MNSPACAPLLRPRTPVLIGAGELTRRRLMRALRDRARYRYVKPMVWADGEGWRITSPCCSRTVDPDGGVIDIARLVPEGDAWALYAKDHAQGAWTLHSSSTDMNTLLETLCTDPARVFWP